MIEIQPLAIADVLLVKTSKLGDHRGFFSETYNKKAFAEQGIHLEFVQDNHSFSAQAGTVRGLHFQSPPFAQDKLVRVIRGRVLDVAVDLRRDSTTFGEHVAFEISADAWNQILVPAGFAHGFCTLEPDTEIFYKASNYYAPDHDFGLFWNDPALGIDWPILPEKAIVSEKDRRLPHFEDLQAYFA